MAMFCKHCFLVLLSLVAYVWQCLFCLCHDQWFGLWCCRMFARAFFHLVIWFLPHDHVQQLCMHGLHRQCSKVSSRRHSHLNVSSSHAVFAFCTIVVRSCLFVRSMIATTTWPSEHMYITNYYALVWCWEVHRLRSTSRHVFSAHVDAHCCNANRIPWDTRNHTMP